MITSLFNKNIVKILAYMAISPGSRYTRKELKEKTEMNNIPLDEAINRLVHVKILRQEKKLYGLNFESEQTKNTLELIQNEYHRLNVTYKVFNILWEVSEKLSKIRNINSVILFGSYAKLVYSERSDIDLAIVFSKKIEEKTKSKIKKMLENMAKSAGKVIQAQFLTAKNLKENTKDPFIQDIIKNGKSL